VGGVGIRTDVIVELVFSRSLDDDPDNPLTYVSNTCILCIWSDKNPREVLLLRSRANTNMFYDVTALLACL
jgi:hypothetical protein